MKKLVFIAVIVAVAFFAGRWHFGDGSTDAASSHALVKLTEADLAEIIRSQSAAGDPFGSILVSSAEAWERFTTGLREHLALGAAAIDEGLDRDPATLRNIAYKRRILLAELFETYLGYRKQEPLPIPDEELNAVWTAGKNEAAFNADMQTLQKVQSEVNERTGTGIGPGILHGESLERAKRKWARAHILSARAEADETFMTSPQVKLRLRVLQAGVLSNAYLREHWATKIRATPDEIRNYISQHPEFDLSRKRDKAEKLFALIKQGADIAKLAAESSEHRPSIETGGLVKDLHRGDMPEEFERVILALEPGELAPQLIETEGAFHIARLEKKTVRKNADGPDVIRYSFRHLMLQKKFEQPGVADVGIPAPFMTAEEIARSAVEEQKRSALIAEMISRYQIEVPNDFSVPTDLTTKPAGSPESE